MTARAIEGLHVASGLVLPIDAVTESMAIIARRGRGKTYTAKVIAEEMLQAHQQIVVIDPLGAWWGLRSSADGKKAGLPITILGGRHGDLPLESTAGAMIADLVVDDGISLLLDLSQFDNDSEQDRFARDFAVRLYQRKKREPAPTPLHLFVDEADSFAPQQPMPGQQQMLGAFQALVRRGRMAGIGTTLITQRPAVLNKSVLTMTECLIVLQVTGPQDRKALEEWVKGNADADEAKTVLSSLASLEVGEAWFWSPSWLRILKRVKVRRALTFDSSATPKAGEVRVAPKVLAPVDLERLSAAMAETVERAAENDPKRLRARLKDLERQVAARAPETVEVTVEVPVPVISPEVLERLEELLLPHAALLGEVRQILRVFAGARYPDPEGTGRALAAEAASESRRKTSKASEPASPRQRTPAAPAPDGIKLGKGERAVLTVLAQQPNRDKNQLALLTGRRPTSSTIGVSLSKLRRAGYLEADRNVATDAGLAWLGDYEELPTGPALRAYWQAHLGDDNFDRRVFDDLLAAYPHSRTKEELQDATGSNRASSTVGVSLSKLRRLCLASKEGQEWRASEEFMEAIKA